MFNKMMKLSLPLLALLAVFSPAPLPAQDTQTQPWRQVDISGVTYVSLGEVMAFYGFTQQAQSASAISFSNNSTNVVLDQAMPFILLDGVAVKLLHPLCKDGRGEQLIAKDDCIKLLDPILRPNYINPHWALRRIVIDPCHGGVFQGVRASERSEKSALVLSIAKQLQARLEAQGFEVILTRKADYYITPHERVDLANNAPDSLFIQLRLNDYNPVLGGIQSYIAEPAAERATDGLNAALGMAIQSYLTVGAGFKDDGLRRAQHDMLSGIRVPAVSIALGNMGNPQQRLTLQKEAQQQAIATALHAAINAFAVAVAPPPAPEPEPTPEPEIAPEPPAEAPPAEAPTPEESEIQAVEVE